MPMDSDRGNIENPKCTKINLREMDDWLSCFLFSGFNFFMGFWFKTQLVSSRTIRMKHLARLIRYFQFEKYFCLKGAIK